MTGRFVTANNLDGETPAIACWRPHSADPTLKSLPAASSTFGSFDFVEAFDDF
jgi:hypothetical protein